MIALRANPNIAQGSNRYKAANDTLFIINKNKIQVNKYLFIYNQDRNEVFKVDNNGLLTYKVRDFGDRFLIEQFNIYKWTVVDTFSSPNSEYLDLENYQLPLHSGLSEFRIMIRGEIIKTFKIESTKPKVKLASKKVTDKIKFNAPTYYELFDSYGNRLLTGTADTIDCSKLPKGKYYLDFDNETTKIKKE